MLQQGLSIDLAKESAEEPSSSILNCLRIVNVRGQKYREQTCFLSSSEEPGIQSGIPARLEDKVQHGGSSRKRTLDLRYDCRVQKPSVISKARYSFNSVQCILIATGQIE